MNNRILVFVLGLFLIVGCTRDQPRTLSPENFAESSLSECQSAECPTITINYFLVAGDDDVSEKINSKITQLIIDSFSMQNDEEESPHTIQSAAEEFVTMYRMDSAEFPGMATAYEIQLTLNSLVSTSRLLSTESKSYTYMGGAHGYGATSYHNFDVETGQELSKDDIINDIAGFTSLAELQFRKKYDIPKEGDINATGFWFEDAVFYLPESIGIMKDAVLLTYNPYEIASYADGMFEIKIPMKKARPYLSEAYIN